VFIAGCGEDPKDDTGVEPVDCTPAADAGADQQVTFGDVVALDGAASQPCDGLEAAVYSWVFDAVPEGSLVDETFLADSGTTTAVVSGFTPDTIGTYVLTLTVEQGELSSGADVVVVEVEAGGGAPVADCGGDLEVDVGTLASLDGSGSSDPDGDSISYAWSLTNTPEGSKAALYTADEAETSLVPDVAGAYDVHLVVSDGMLESEPAYCVVTAVADDLPPVADAGEGGTLPPCDEQILQLEGYGSYDPEGEPLTYAWSVLEKPEGSALTDADFDTSYVAPSVSWDVEGTYGFQLSVNDGAQWSAPDVVVFTVSACPDDTGDPGDTGEPDDPVDTGAPV